MNALMCPTEPRTTMSTPFIEIPQRADGVAVDDEQAAAAGRARRLARVAVDDDAARTSCSRRARCPRCRARARSRACSCRRSSSRRARRSRPRARRRGRTRRACAPFGLTTRQRRGPRRVAGEVVQALVELAQRRHREVDDLDRRRSRRRPPSDARPLPGVDDAGLGLPQRARPRRPGAPRSRGTRTPSRPSRRSRRAPPACTRSGRAARRSRRPCRRAKV